MSRPSSINRFKLFIVALVFAASAGCSPISEPEARDCRDEFEAADGYRDLCEHVAPIQ